MKLSNSVSSIKSASAIAPSERTKLLLGITGSVAAVKGPELAVKLVQTQKYDVKVILTQGGEHFWKKSGEYSPRYWNKLKDLINKDDERIQIYNPTAEWAEWNRLGDPVLHIELRDWAEVCLVAPLSAHSLAKFATGLCDDTLSCVVRAWMWDKPLLLCPAMNTQMYLHPLTKQQLDTIQGFSSSPENVKVIEPQRKQLACGQTGTGAMASVWSIMESVDVCVAESFWRSVQGADFAFGASDDEIDDEDNASPRRPPRPSKEECQSEEYLDPLLAP